jgi:hypothetical protein
MTRSVCFVLVSGPQAAWEGARYLQFAEKLLWEQTWPQDSTCYRLTRDPKEADIILILEPNYFKTRAYLEELAALEELQRFPQKCFVVNQDDNPVPLLPGVYVAMPTFRREGKMVIPYCYLVPSPNKVLSANDRREVVTDLLFSFRGAASAPVRRRLFDLAPRLVAFGRGKITRVNRWFDHTAEEERAYVDEILRSKFVLCPRGQGVASHRLFEVMELGRVPVILADDWWAPVGPEWGKCSIRIREKNVGNLLRVLQVYEDRFQTMGRAARVEWETWFAPQRRLVWMLAKIESLQDNWILHARDLRRRWRDPWTWRRERSWLRWAWHGACRRARKQN